MDLLHEVEFRPPSHPHLLVYIRRISMARRLRFLAQNHDLMRTVNFPRHGEAAGLIHAQERAEAEIELSRRILSEMVDRIDGAAARAEAIADWLIQEAPQTLCVEILERAGEAMILGEESRKK
jgi:hypothetical protein